MTARKVHAILAAGVQAPDLIEEWQRSPDTLRGLGVDPSAFNLAALRNFAGLTVKVRHNPVRQDLPLTFRLMSLLEIEIEIFSSYATVRSASGNPFATGTAQRAAEFVAFLEGWLDFEQPSHLAVWDIVRHEQAISSLLKIDSPSPLEANGENQRAVCISQKDQPFIRGAVRPFEMTFHPRALAASLLRHKFDSSALEVTPGYYCYWRKSVADPIQFLELNALAFHFLSFVDGTRLIEDIQLLLTGSREDTFNFLECLKPLLGLGVFSVRYSGEMNPR